LTLSSPGQAIGFGEMGYSTLGTVQLSLAGLVLQIALLCLLCMWNEQRGHTKCKICGMVSGHDTYFQNQIAFCQMGL
jgi:hypothetical protein